jgi:hypothetical protein
MEVFAHSILVAIFSHLAHEAFYITANRCRGFDQIAVFERALMREQIIMHLPKLPLRTGRKATAGWWILISRNFSIESITTNLDLPRLGGHGTP